MKSHKEILALVLEEINKPNKSFDDNCAEIKRLNAEIASIVLPVKDVISLEAYITKLNKETEDLNVLASALRGKQSLILN